MLIQHKLLHVLHTIFRLARPYLVGSFAQKSIAATVEELRMSRCQLVNTTFQILGSWMHLSVPNPLSHICPSSKHSKLRNPEMTVYYIASLISHVEAMAWTVVVSYDASSLPLT